MEDGNTLTNTDSPQSVWPVITSHNYIELICFMKIEQLSLEVKVEIIIREGIHLGTSQSSIFQTDLYAVGSDLVEVVLFPTTRDFVHVRMADDKMVEKYLYPLQAL